MIFHVKMIKSFEAYVEVEAENADDACFMIAQGDFSNAVDGTYDEDLSEAYITNVRAYGEDEDEILCEWDADEEY